MIHLKKRLQLKSLKHSIFLAIALMITAVITVLYFYADIVVTAERQASYNFNRLAQNSCARFETSMSKTLEIAEYATYSYSFQSFLLSDTPEIVIDSKISAQDVLNFISYSMGDAKDIVLFSNRGRKLSVTNAYGEIAHAAIDSLDLNPNVVFTKTLYSPVIFHHGCPYLVCLMSSMGTSQGYRSNNNIITTCIIYDMNDILKALSIQGYDESITILSKNDIILGSTCSTLSQNLIQALTQAHPNDTTVTADHRSWFFRQDQIGDSDWTVISLIPKSSLSTLLSGNLTVILILLVLLSITFLMFWLLMAIHRDIRHIVHDLVYQANETIFICEPRLQEFKIITHTLSHTLYRLKEANEKQRQLTADKYEALIAQKQAQMQAYRRQINPHFLFNTLETVRSLAHHYKIQPLEQLIGGMSQMFRYALHAPTMVKLSDELEHLKGYMSIMDVRFPNRYCFKTNIAQNTLSFPVLSMLLQPVAENAIQHGFSQKGQGTLLIQTFLQSDGRLSIRMIDNGMGLKPDQLTDLIKKIHETDNETNVNDTSIGLVNIRKRLKLAFGEHAHLFISSVSKHYTMVEFIIPGPDA